MTPPKPKPTIRRSLDMATDLNAWLTWYSAYGGRSAIGIVDEALRAFYEQHKADYPNGPKVTSTPMEALDGRRKSHDV